MSPVGPDSLSWHRGRSPFLVVAPHGGRRETGRPVGERTRINDLGTAELARELAARLDGSFLVNDRIDRNRIDLNRVHEVHTKAPWFVERLGELLASIAEQHGHGTVLFVHGWNVVQPKCDIGVGRYLTTAAEAEPGMSGLTVSASFAERRLDDLGRAAARRGIDVVWGERYPASHPNNVLQLFRRDGHDGCPERLRSLVDAGWIDAVQLELGIPLRWPGRFREALVESVVEALRGNGSTTVDTVRTEPSTKVRGRERAFFLQTHDPRTGLGVIAGLAPDRRRTGRFVLLPEGGPETVLFVGEDVAGPPTSVGGLAFEELDRGFRVRFAGPAVGVADGSLWLRTEDALAASRLVDVVLRLEYRSDEKGRYGVVTGDVAVDGDRRSFRAVGFSDPRFSRIANSSGGERVVFTASFGAARAFGGDFDGGAGALVSFVDGVQRPDGEWMGRLRRTGKDRSPASFRVETNGGETLSATPVSAMVLLRSVDGGRLARVTFGTARFSSSRGQEGVGFYEHLRPVDPAELL